MGRERARAKAAELQYNRMPKRLVGPATAGELRSIHENLAVSDNPGQLFAGGSAAVEAAIVGEQFSQRERLDLLQRGEACWQRATETLLGEDPYGYVRGRHEHEQDCRHDMPDTYRLAMSRASIPVIEGMVEGDVTREKRERYYGELLSIAAYNATDLLHAQEAGDRDAFCDHTGIAYEALAPLVTNRLLSPTLIALPTIARGGSGHHYPRQTHDILLLHLDWGRIEDVTTIEVKSTLQADYSSRYEAMLLGGRLDLLMPDSSSPVDTVEALTREYDGTINPGDKASLEGMTDKVIHLMRHHRQRDAAGRRCEDMMRCESIPAQRSGTQVKSPLGAQAISTTLG